MDQLVQQLGRLLAQFDWTSVVDISILALLFYGLLAILQGTRAEILFRGMIIVLLAGFIITAIWPTQLPVLRWLVSNLLQVLLVAVLVIFAPEMRRALEQIGHTGDFINRPLVHRSLNITTQMIEDVVEAAFYLSNQRWGGLIVIERTTGLQDIANRGTLLDAEVSSSLLGNLFVPNTPLHDGAVIIRQNRIVAAGCILPLSENLGHEEHLGTRHKAGVGISEQSDAVSLIVSEETGKISIANNGRLSTFSNPETLREKLQSLLQPSVLKQDGQPSRLRVIRRSLQRFPSRLNNSLESVPKPARLPKNREELRPVKDTGNQAEEKHRALLQKVPGRVAQAEEPVAAERQEP